LLVLFLFGDEFQVGHIAHGLFGHESRVPFQARGFTITKGFLCGRLELGSLFCCGD
jgi:hypothetical protein